jgi:transcriptional regulator
MYTVNAYASPTDAEVFDLMRQYSFATVITTADDGPYISHLPIYVDGVPGEIVALRGHMARANEQWARMERGDRCLIIFHGPNAYLSPQWYEPVYRSGDFVEPPARAPTWNYAVVHVTGDVRVFHDVAETDALLDEAMGYFETRNQTGWDHRSYPDERRNLLRQHIVAFEMTGLTVTPKFKLNQIHSKEEIVSGALGLMSTGRDDARAVGKLMQDCVRRQTR